MSIILIVAGGNRPPLSLLDELPDSDHVFAADGGYEIAVALGLNIDVLIGDMDSLPDHVTVDPKTEQIQHPEDKDATDLELAFEYSMRHQPERIVLIGGEGGRLDHEFSTLSLIGSDRWSMTPEIDWVRSDGIVHVVRGTRRIQGDIGHLVSLVSAHGTAHGVSTRGLQWNLNSADLHAGSSLGTSNRFAMPSATISVGLGCVYVVIPAEGQPESPATADGSSAG